MSDRRQYTDKEKIAYYKAKAAAAQKSGYTSKQGYIAGRGAYKSKKKAPPKQKKPRSTMSGLAGLGDYGGPAGTAIGTALGGPVGGLIGGGLGTLAGSLFKHFVGKGDYQVVNNAFLKDGQLIEPVINKHKSGGDVFRRQEYLTDIVTSSSANTFLLQAFDLNPGLNSTFEWLSQVAANYEEYEFEGLYFEFRSMSADALNSTNTALGQVIMAANYNAAAPNFNNKQQMENYEGGISCRPSECMRYFVECAKLRTVLNELYIRTGAVPAGQDQRLYDLCNFQIATNGFQGTSVNVGELWVSYQVVLRKPKLFSALGLYSDWASITPVGGSYTDLLPLGSSGSWNYSPSDTLNGIVATGTTLSWSPPSVPRTYMIYIVWTGSSTVITNQIATFSNGLTSRSLQNSPANGITTTIASSLRIFTYRPQDNPANANPTISYAGGTLPSSGTAVTIYIVQLPNTLYGV